MKHNRMIPAGLILLFLFTGTVFGFAPREIKLERASYRKVTISWLAPDTATQIANYRIYRNGTEIATTASLNYTDESVQPGIDYTYQVVAATVGGGDSEFSSELPIKTLTSSSFSGSTNVETVVDSFHDIPAINLSALSFLSGAKSAFEAILGSNVSFSVIDEKIVSGVLAEKLSFITAVAPELTEAERFAAQVELNSIMTESFSGNSFDHVYIHESLVQLGEQHWMAGNVTAARLFYEFSFNYMANNEFTVYNSLNRLAHFAKAHLTKDSASSAIVSGLNEAQNHSMRFFDFFPNPANQNFAKYALQSPVQWYFAYFPKMLEYANYDALFFASALNQAQQLHNFDIEDKKSVAILEKIAAWELIHLQVRFVDENGNSRPGSVKICNESAANGKEYLFPDEPFSDERIFALSNGSATVPVYAGHDYSALVEINVPGGEKLTFDIPEFRYSKNKLYTYDYISDTSTDASSSQSRVNIVVPTLNYPYNLRVDRGIDVFDLSWDWVALDSFNTVCFKVFRGNTPIATVTTNQVRLPLDNALGEFTYRVVAFDANGAPSASSRPITVLPGDQTQYSDFFAWLQLYFDNQEMYSHDDPDGDGVDNYHEFLNGTDPTKAPASTPQPGPRGFNELTLEWEGVTNISDAQYEISRDGMVVGISTQSKFTDTDLIPGVSHVYRVRLIAPTASATDWSQPNTMSTQKAHNYPNAEKVQQVVDTFVKMDILAYTGTNLVSAVKSSLEALTGSNITFTVIDRDLLNTMVDQELELLNKISPPMTVAERITARTELDQLMTATWGGNSFEEMYINSKLSDLADAHWADFLDNRAKTSSRTAAFELQETALLFLTNHEPTVSNILNRMSAMHIQGLSDQSNNDAILAALDNSRDTLLRIYDYFPNPSSNAGNPYRKIISDYWKYFPRLLSYDKYDQPLFNRVLQLATLYYKQDVTDAARRKQLNKIAAWQLTQLIVNSNGISGSLKIRNISDSLPDSPWASVLESEDIREITLSGTSVTIPVYAGHLYEVTLKIPVPGGEDWVRVIDNLTFGSNLQIIDDPFNGQTIVNLPGNSGASELNLTAYPVTFPYNLRAEKYPDVFNLSWEYVPQPNQSIIGYHIYRGDERISTVSSKIGFNIPRQVYADGVYVYSVTAIDAAGFESPKSPAFLMIPDFSDEELRYFEWKRKYFGDAPALATDVCSDGLTNYQKFLLGANPLLSASDFDPENITGKLSGVRVNYFQLKNSEMPDFIHEFPYKTEGRKNFCFPSTSSTILASGKSEKVAMTVDGFFETPSDGMYSFVVKADDGVRVMINGAAALEHLLLDSPREKIRTVRLKAGLNSIQVQYFNYQNSAELQLFWAKQGEAMQDFSHGNSTWHTENPSPELMEYILSRRDSDWDGLSDFEEMIYGTDPFNPDSSGNGVSDYDEIKSNAEESVPDEAFDLQQEINGSAYSRSIGAWQNVLTRTESISRRGELHYASTFERSGIFKVEFLLSSAQATGNANQFDLYVDGKFISSIHLKLDDSEKVIGMQTPYLGTGEHEFSIIWDNHLPGEALTVNKLKIYRARNNHTNAQGSGQEAGDSIERIVLGQRNQVATAPVSRTSPYCLTGTSAFPEFTAVNGDPVGVYAKDKWFKNIPLNSGNPTLATVFFENGGLQKEIAIDWAVTDPVSENGRTFNIRKGDALLLSASAENSNAWQISGNGVALNGDMGSAEAQIFNETGAFTLTANCLNTTGNVVASGSIIVNVVDYEFPKDDVICLVSYGREWRTALNPDEVALKTDARYSAAFVETDVSGEKYFKVFTDDNKPRYNYAVIESGDDEIILDVQKTQGVEVYSSNFTGIREVESSEDLVIDDDMKVYNMVIVASPMRSDLELRLNIFVAGVTFEDGTVSKTITSADFDATGLCPVNFIRPNEVGTSICHTMQAYQNNEYIGIRQR